MTEPMPRERAERIARSHACGRCGEYSWKKLKVAAPDAAAREALGAVWMAHLVCGVCDTAQDVVIDADGDLIVA